MLLLLRPLTPPPRRPRCLAAHIAQPRRARQHSVDPAHYGDPGLDGIVKSVARIREGGWDYVVLQDQSGEWFEMEPPNLWNYGTYNVQQRHHGTRVCGRCPSFRVLTCTYDEPPPCKRNRPWGWVHRACRQANGIERGVHRTCRQANEIDLPVAHE